MYRMINSNGGDTGSVLKETHGELELKYCCVSPVEKSFHACLGLVVKAPVHTVALHVSPNSKVTTRGLTEAMLTTTGKAVGITFLVTFMF